MTITEQKVFLRKRAKFALKNLFSDKNLYYEISKSVASYFLQSDEYKEAPCLLGYMALDDEVSLLPILQKALSDNKKVCLPRMIPGTNMMDFYYIEDLQSNFTSDNAFNIKEPNTDCTKVSTNEVPNKSVFLVPGLAFNLTGSRLGRGKGYYDKYLSSLHGDYVFCGVCSVEVITKDIPIEKNDVFMTHLLSEYGFIKCK